MNFTSVAKRSVLGGATRRLDQHLDPTVVYTRRVIVLLPVSLLLLFSFKRY